MVNKNEVADKGVKKKAKKKISALKVDALLHSAVDHVRADSSSDILGSSGLINTGPVANYKRRK